MLDAVLVLPIMLYAFVNSITPGPNNTMLLASGLNFGFKATIPHVLGITAGVVTMLLLTGMGLQQIFHAYPIINEGMKIIGAVYLAYLAWRIARSGQPSQKQKKVARPMLFSEAVLFQGVNPKAWMMVLGFFAAYMPDTPDWKLLLLISLVFGMVNICCICVWAFLGQQLQALFNHPKHRTYFNYTMAFLLLVSIAIII